MSKNSFADKYTHFALKNSASPLALLMAATLGLSAPVYAQDADKAIVLDPISIDAKADVITGGVQVEEEDLERIDPVTIRDVFRQEPGVTVGSPVVVSQKIYVNGIEDSNLAVDIDGARQQNKTFHHTGTTIVDPSMLKAVKIETGVAPADAGPQALGGSISLETKDGRDIVGPDEIFGGFAKLSYNSNTKGFSEDLALASRYENIDAMLYVTNAGGHDFKDGGGREVAGTAPEHKNILFKFGATSPTGYRLKISANHFEDEGVRSGRQNFTFNGVHSWTQYIRNNYSISFGDETPTDMWDPKFNLSYTFAGLDTKLNNPPSVIADITTLNGKASNTFTTNLGKITVGTDFYYDVGDGGMRYEHSTETATNFGLFSQARLSLTDEFRTSFGGRVDHNRFKGNDGTKLDNTGLSGNVNVEYDVTTELMGYAGAGTVFGGIPISDIGIMDDNLTYENLTPSRSYNYKVGAAYEVGGLTVDGNLFYTEIDDAHNLVEDDRSTSEDVQSMGFNVSAKYNYGNGFVHGSFSRAKLSVDSQAAGLVSGYFKGVEMGDMATFQVNHTFPDYGITIGSTNEYVFKNDRITVRATGKPLPSYFVANAYAEWAPEDLEALTLRFDVTNILDKDYGDRANAAYDYSGRANITQMKEPGRTFLITAKYDF